MKLIKFAQELNDKYKCDIVITFETNYILLDLVPNLKNFLNRLNIKFKLEVAPSRTRIFILIYELDIKNIDDLLNIIEKNIRNIFPAIFHFGVSHLQDCKCIFCHSSNKKQYEIYLKFHKNFEFLRKKLKDVLKEPGEYIHNKWNSDSSSFYFNLNDDEYNVINDLVLLLFNRNLEESYYNIFKKIK